MAMYNEITVEAELTNTEYMITKNYNLLENKPQINSVELIGNKSLEDLGINPDAEENIIDTVKVNGAALTPDANKAVDVTITTGTNNGTVKVNGTDVNVKGLKSAAYTESSAYDVSGAAATVQGNVDALAVVVSGKVDKVQGKGLSTNDYTNEDKAKLAGIQAGAQVNTVTSVAGKTGAVTLNKSDVGLGNVNNTSDANKPVSNATQNALNLKADTSAVNTALAGKVDKVSGKGLSTEDFTTTEKTKLAGISAEANKVEITPVVTEGTTLATISIDGVDTDIKGSDIDVDDEMSPTSHNPVENKVIYEALNNILPEETAEGNPISITDASGLSAKSCEVTMNHIQDLHGYDYPWVGGAGKNKLPMTVSSIKALNIGGTWNDNVYTLKGASFTINTDNDGNVTDIKANGQASESAVLYLGSVSMTNGTTYTVNGLPSDGSNTTFGFQSRRGNIAIENYYNASDNNYTSTADEDILFVLVIRSGYNTQNLMFKPMIRLSTVTDPTFAPYSNICPISGWDSLHLYIDTEQTETPETTHTATFPDTVYGGKYEFVSGKATLDKKFVSIDGSENWTEYPENSGKFFNNNAIEVNEAAIVRSDTQYISNMYKFKGDGSSASTQITTDKSFYGQRAFGRFWVYDSDYVNDLAAFETMLNTTPLQICYPLTTPIEITLTAEQIELLKGANVLWTDGDNITLKYSADIKEWVLAQLQS